MTHLPPQSVEAVAREIAEHAGIDMLDDYDLFIAEMSSALTRAREDAKEEAARIAEEMAQTEDGEIWIARKIADAIRASKEPK